MNNYLIPADEKFVEDIARAIARNRLLSEADDIVDEMIGDVPDIDSALEDAVDLIFEQMWGDTSVNSRRQRDMYRDDARAAISIINLKFLTMAE